MAKNEAEQGRVCRRCERSGHATLMWHWAHGAYCVFCIRQLMTILSDFAPALNIPKPGDGANAAVDANGAKVAAKEKGGTP